MTAFTEADVEAPAEGAGKRFRDPDDPLKAPLAIQAVHGHRPQRASPPALRRPQLEARTAVAPPPLTRTSTS